MEYSKWETGVLEDVWEFSGVSGDVKLNWSECSLPHFSWSVRPSFAGLPQVQLWIRLGDKCDHHQGSQIVPIFTPVTASPICRWRNPLTDRSSTTSAWPAISEPFEASFKKSTDQTFAWENLYRVWWMFSPACSNGSPPWTHLSYSEHHLGLKWIFIHIMENCAERLWWNKRCQLKKLFQPVW